MFEQLQSLPFNVGYNLIAVTEECSLRSLMDRAHPQQALDTKSSKWQLLIFMLGDTTDAPSTGANLTEEKSLKSHLHLLHNIETVFKL